MRLPYYRSKLFWVGTVVLVSLLASRWDSNRYSTWLSCRWGTDPHYRGFDITSENGTISLSAGRPYQGLFNISWTGVESRRTLSVGKGASNRLATPISFEWEAKDRGNITIAYWLLLSSFMLVWISDFAWWRFRYRRQATPPPSLS